MKVSLSRSIKVSEKLFFLMGVVMISLAMVGSAGYYYLAKASREMASMYTNNLLPVKWLNDNRNQSRALDADMFDLMMTTDKIKKVRIKNDITERTKLFDQNLANYEKTRLDSSELDTLKSLHDNLQVYYANRDEVINLAMQDKAADAYKLFNTTVRGSINSMHIKIMIAFRRVNTPVIPMQNNATAKPM